MHVHNYVKGEDGFSLGQNTEGEGVVLLFTSSLSERRINKHNVFLYDVRIH